MTANVQPMESNHGGARPGAGAPVGNSNRTRSGVRAWAAVSRLPKGCGSARRALYSLRHELEAAVGALYDGVSIYHAALIQSAIRHEGRAQLLARWMRTEPELPLAERVGILREIGNATDSRDRCLKQLGLVEPPDATDPWAALDSQTVDAAPGATGDATNKPETTEADQGLSAGLADTTESGPSPLAPRGPATTQS